MKIVVRILLITVLYTCLLSSCGMKPAEEPLVVYSFSGENEMFSISNGVIVLNEGEEIFYGGNLDGELSDIIAYSMTFYIQSGSDDIVLLSNSVTDMTGGTIGIAGETGKISGDVLKSAEEDDLQNNLYFELKTTNLGGEENTYQLQLTVTEITKTKDS
ncbi:hypothetical protein AALA82_17415 [Oscillospiraceae bacterium 50-16]